MESYRTDTLNTGKAFCVERNGDEYAYPPQCSGGFYGDDRVFVGDYDIREAFAYRLNRMKETGTFAKQWPQSDFLWLLHWMDTKAEGYDYKAITAERLAMLPEHVQKAIAYSG